MTCTVDVLYEHDPWTCSMDVFGRHALQTYPMYVVLRGHASWACTVDEHLEVVLAGTSMNIQKIPIGMHLFLCILEIHVCLYK